MGQPSSSLDRFLRNRAPAYIGLGGTKMSVAVNGTLGVILTLIGSLQQFVGVLVLTDGDAVPDTGLQAMPSAVSDVLIVGVGNVARGTFLDSHLSRQDGASLSQVARRLGGHYHDGNLKNVPGELLRQLTRCKAIGRFGLGVDNIDIKAAAELAAIKAILIP